MSEATEQIILVLAKAFSRWQLSACNHSKRYGLFGLFTGVSLLHPWSSTHAV
jgi:hypothetical protein